MSNVPGFSQWRQRMTYLSTISAIIIATWLVTLPRPRQKLGSIEIVEPIHTIVPDELHRIYVGVSHGSLPLLVNVVHFGD